MVMKYKRADWTAKRDVVFKKYGFFLNKQASAPFHMLSSQNLGLGPAISFHHSCKSRQRVTAQLGMCQALRKWTNALNLIKKNNGTNGNAIKACNELLTELCDVGLPLGVDLTPLSPGQDGYSPGYGVHDYNS